MSDKKISRRELAAMTAGVAALAALPAEAAQPNMQSALDHLRAAYSFLDKAKENKGGHRVKAMEYTAAAIDRVKRGINHAS